MNIVNHFEQGTKEWHDFRRCRVTGTKLDDVMGTPFARLALAADLISEEGTEQCAAIVTTAEMERGIAEEDFALKLFQERTGKVVEKVGACISTEYDWLMLSPDGLIRDPNTGKYTEAVEVKSPHSKIAILYQLINLLPADEVKLTPAKKHILGVPQDYIWQVVNYFIVNEDLQTLHFVIYDARFIEDEKKMYVVEVKRENEVLQDLIKQAKTALVAFRADWMRWRDVVLPSKF